MSHPSVMLDGEREVLPVDRFEITKDAIDDAKSGLQVRVSLVVLGAHDAVSSRDGSEHCIVRFVADAFALDCEVKEGLGAEVSLVLEFGDNHRKTG